MKVAVTGATGFLGNHVIAQLRRRSFIPTLVLRPGNSGSAQELPHVYLDINDPPEDAYSLLGRPDTLVHLAWGGLPNYHSLHHFELELPCQYKFLSGLVRSGLRHLVVTGTCYEYGMSSGPMGEQIESKPTNPYGFAKDCLRKQLEFLQKTEPFSLTWCRLFYLYGDGQSESSLYSQFKRAILNGQETFPMSGGEQLRDFLSVEEACRILVELSSNPRGHGVVNVCSGKPISVRRLVEEWIENLHGTISTKLGHYPYPTHEPMAFWGDDRKLRKCLENQVVSPTASSPDGGQV